MTLHAMGPAGRQSSGPAGAVSQVATAAQGPSSVDVGFAAVTLLRSAGIFVVRLGPLRLRSEPRTCKCLAWSCRTTEYQGSGTRGCRC